MTMTRSLVLLLALLACPVPLFAQLVSTPPLLLRDEGVDKGRLTKAVDFVGSAVTCTWTAGVGTCTITGGSGGANTVEQSIAMTGGAGVYSQVVTGQAWVTGTSVIVCGPLGTTADGLTVEQVAVAGLTVTVDTRVAGTGFTIHVKNPFGSKGTHRIHCTGA